MRARIVNKPTRWVTYASMVLAGIVAMLGLVVVAYGAYLATFLELPKSDDHPPLRLYSGPFLLKPELSLAHSHLLERLQRLGYRRVKATQAPGDYQLTEEALTIYLHPQPENYIGATMVMYRDSPDHRRSPLLLPFRHRSGCRGAGALD
jgi:hypothetical protein